MAGNFKKPLEMAENVENPLKTRKSWEYLMKLNFVEKLIKKA